jgi:hypothetical protein
MKSNAPCSGRLGRARLPPNRSIKDRNSKRRHLWDRSPDRSRVAARALARPTKVEARQSKLETPRRRNIDSCRTGLPTRPTDVDFRRFDFRLLAASCFGLFSFVSACLGSASRERKRSVRPRALVSHAAGEVLSPRWGWGTCGWHWTQGSRRWAADSRPGGAGARDDRRGCRSPPAARGRGAATETGGACLTFGVSAFRFSTFDFRRY